MARMPKVETIRRLVSSGAWMELMVWVGGVVFLLVREPGPTDFTVCPVKNLTGMDCPGCGLGESITWLFRGEWQQSLDAHYLGAAALGMVLMRIVKLCTLVWSNYKNLSYE